MLRETYCISLCSNQYFPHSSFQYLSKRHCGVLINKYLLSHSSCTADLFVKILFPLILFNYYLQNLVKIHSFLFYVRYLPLSTRKQYLSSTYLLNHACFDVLLIWLKSAVSEKNGKSVSHRLSGHSRQEMPCRIRVQPGRRKILRSTH